MLRHLSHAVRSLRRFPASAAAAVLTLAVVVGAGLPIVSLVDAALLRPLPYPNPDALVQIGEVPREGGETGLRSVAYPTFVQWRDAAGRLVSAFEAFDPTNVTVVGPGGADRKNAMRITPTFLQMLGVRPVAGRLLRQEDVGEPVAIVSSAFARAEFLEERAALGQSITASGVLYTIVGVLPSTFNSALSGAELWIPLSPSAGEQSRRDGKSIQVIARVASGASQADLSRVLGRISADSAPPALAVVRPLGRAMLGDADRTLWVLLVACALAFTIAVVNLASLLIVRVIDRDDELAIRLALGARRRWLFGQLALESYLLVFLGTACGVLVALWLMPVVSSLAAEHLGATLARSLALNGRVLGVYLVAASAAAGLCSLAPAFRLRLVTVKTSRRGTTAARPQLLIRRSLIVGQLAIAFLLVFVVILIGGSLQRLLAVDPGFRTANTLAASLSLPAPSYSTPSSIAGFYGEVVRRAQSALEPTARVAIVDEMPLTGDRGRIVVSAEGSHSTIEAVVRTVSPGYFPLLGIPIHAGRDFEDRDDGKAPPRALISVSLARRLPRDSTPLGHRLRVGSAGAVAEVVGVVGDVKHGSLAQDDLPTLYVAAWQQPSRSTQILVRSEQPFGTVLSILRAEVGRMDSSLPVYSVRTLDEVRRTSPGLRTQRLLSWTLGAFALLAAVLAGVGVFGLFSHDVAARRRELGLRVALGAAPRSLQSHVLGQAGVLVAAGVAIGSCFAVLAGSSLGAILFGVTATDPLTYLLGATVMALVAVIAATVPARRATRSDPMVVLKNE